MFVTLKLQILQNLNGNICVFIVNLMLHEAGEVLVSLPAVSALVRSVGNLASSGAVIGQSLGVQELAGGLVLLHESE